jgi:predicted transcriptional regulator
MEVHVTPETAKKLNDLAATTGRAPEQLVEDALVGYLEELVSLRQTLDSRYDDLKSGRVEPIDGEAFFQRLKEREVDLTNRPLRFMRVRDFLKSEL